MMSSQNYKKQTLRINETLTQLSRNFIFTVSTFALLVGCTTAYSNNAQQPEALTDAILRAVTTSDL